MTTEPDTLRRRNQELAILNEVAGVLNRSADLESVLEGVLGRVAELLGLDAGWIWLLAEDGSGTSYLAASRNLPPGLAQHPERMDTQSCWCLDEYRKGTLKEAESISVISCSRLAPLDEEAAGGLRYHASVPLLSGGRKLGLMNVAGAEHEELSDEDLRLLYTVGDMLSIAVERSRLYEGSLRAGAVEERYRLAREIHDTLGQGLAGVLMRLETLDAMLEAAPEAPEGARRLSRETLELTRKNLDEARRAVLDLRGAELEGRTLEQALKGLAVEMTTPSAQVKVTVKGARTLSVRVEAGLFRIAQEAVRNAVEHASPRRVEVSLMLTRAMATLTVVDDGVGFDPATPHPDRWGLTGVSERAHLLGGDLSVEGAPGRGTKLVATIPLVD